MASISSDQYGRNQKNGKFPPWIIPVGIVALVCVIIAVLVTSKPEPKKRKPNQAPGIFVDTLLVERQNFQPQITSYGLVEPKTRSRLVAQVSGRVEYVADRFRDGGYFKNGDLLLQIEPTDYEIALHVAEANLAEAEKDLEEEIAEAEQAKANWKLIGKQTSASALALREPQLKAARAMVKSQKALLKQAQVNLARTEIRAPFDGRVITTDVDLGQVAASNSVLGEIYATDAIEIRLPVKNGELSMLSLPETYSHLGDQGDDRKYPSADIISTLAGNEVWESKIIRTSGSVDDSSRQLYVFASIEDPFGEKAEGRFPLKIGQYVTAKIDGEMMEDVSVIPNSAIYQGAYLFVFRDNAVFRRPIQISWQNSELAVIGSGIDVGEEVVVSPMGQVASGTIARTKKAGDKKEKN